MHRAGVTKDTNSAALAAGLFTFLAAPGRSSVLGLASSTLRAAPPSSPARPEDRPQMAKGAPRFPPAAVSPLGIPLPGAPLLVARR